MSVLQKGIDTTTRLVTTARRNKRVTVDEPTVKVNLGSGIEVAPGWINIDASLHAAIASLPVPLVKLAYRLSGSSNTYTEDDYITRVKNNRFVLHDLTNGIPLEDDTADFVYIGHFVEVLPREETEKLVRDIARVLKSGGIFRIAGMDLEEYIELYRLGQKDKAVRELLGGGPYTLLNQRRYFYDQETLSEVLRGAGFTSIERKRFREGKVPDLELIEKERTPILILEASQD